MKKKLKLFSVLLIVLTISTDRLIAQYCTTGNCNSNAYVNSTDRNTIEYDNIVSVFHSTMLRESNGDVKVWGQGVASNGTGHIAPPIIVNSTNFPSLSGTVLKFAAASSGQTQQFAVLSTDGLYIWGTANTLVSTAVKSSTTFGAVAIGTSGVAGTKADGLPAGVLPADVKMMFGSNGTLAIVTCSGDAWVLSFLGAKNGDGTPENATNGQVWHRVKTNAAGNPNLSNVVALRGSRNAMIALTADGKLFTWGTGTYDGASSPVARSYATEMTIPGTGSAKMIGMNYSASGISYYLLMTDGALYSLGRNANRQLGVFSQTDSNSWVQVHRPTNAGADSGTLFNDVVWISPNEHDSFGEPAINIITQSGKLYAWGSNSGNMIGGATSGSYYDPLYMPGGLNTNDVLLAVETGGHTTITIKQCSKRFGYVGHRTNGSMGDTTTGSSNPNTYNFTNTAEVSICGATAAPAVQDLKICLGFTANLSQAHIGNIPLSSVLVWYTTPDRLPGTQVADPSVVGPGTYYAFYIPSSGNCDEPPVSLPVNVSYYTQADPEYQNCGAVCTEEVDGADFTTSNGTAVTFNQPATNYGYQFDIYSLDNSFNLTINGVVLATQEIEFQASGSVQNIRFDDGSIWGAGGIPQIYSLTGTAAAPIIRVTISPTGQISMFGSKTSGGILYPLQLFNGNTFNTIVWNTNSSNVVTATQSVIGATNMTGRGKGLNVRPCHCIKPGASGTPDSYAKFGITTRLNPTVDNWPTTVPNAHIVLDSADKGLVLTHMTTAQRNNLIPVDGMLIYNTDLNCVQLYRGTVPGIDASRTGWNCLERGCNDY